MTATLMGRITGRRRAAEQKTLDSYQQLVAAVADDPESVDPARADAILLDAAKRPVQLEADVAELRQRRLDAEIAARLPQLEKERAEAGNKLGTMRDAVSRATREYQAAQQAFNLRDGELRSQIEQAQAAVSRLRAGRPDARETDLRSEKHRLQQRRGVLLGELGGGALGLTGRAASLRDALKRGPHVIEKMGPVQFFLAGGVWDEMALRNNIAAVEGEIRGRENELSQIDARLAVVNGELDAIERRQLSAE